MPIFNNISKSEDRHQQVVLEMIKKYDINFEPKTERGKYNDPEMEKLYLELVEQGKKSLVDALKVGALIEDMDIYDLNNAIKQTDNQDLTIVFTNIRTGSYHHIKAFTNWLKRYNITYQPKYISEQELNDILSK